MKLGDLLLSDDEHIVYSGTPKYSFVGYRPTDKALGKLYDTVIYELCSCRLANERNRGYNECLSWVLEQIKVLEEEYLKEEEEKNWVPAIGDKLICVDAEELSNDDSFYKDVFVTNDTYTVSSVSDHSKEGVIMFEEVCAGIYLEDLKNWFKRSVNE